MARRDGRGRHRAVRWLLGAVAAAGLLLLLPACGPAEAPPPSAVRATVEAECACGKLERVNGVAVLTLWGEPYERGYAHGRLVARGVVEMVDAICGSNLLLTRRRDYERTILPLVDRFAFEPDDEAELRGVFDGVRSRLGEGAVLRRIGRPLTLRDLKAYNTCGDWYRQACSSFAAWGSRARDGHVWVGRNFDFPPAEAYFAHQMIVLHRPQGAKRAWAAVGAPGLLGCVTGVNDRGVFASVHDAFLPLRPLERGYAPRLLVLRRLMEACEARDLEAQALPILEARRQMFDNAILLAAPVCDGTPPALVLEYDGDLARDKGVTVRRPEDNAAESSRELIACTNHFRKRVKPKFSPVLRYRYPLMRRVLMAKTDRGQKVGFHIARKTMGAVRLPITLYTVIADLNTLDLWFAPGEFLSPPGRRDYVKLPLREWLAPNR